MYGFVSSQETVSCVLRNRPRSASPALGGDRQTLPSRPGNNEASRWVHLPLMPLKLIVGDEAKMRALDWREDIAAFNAANLSNSTNIVRLGHIHEHIRIGCHTGDKTCSGLGV